MLPRVVALGGVVAALAACGDGTAREVDGDAAVGETVADTNAGDGAVEADGEVEVGGEVAPDPAEAALRARLGVPAEARRVLVFAQNAHLDIDWQDTFDGYFDRFVGGIFDQALALLAADPRAHYSVAEMAFLARYVDARPGAVAALRAGLERGALHIVGGMMTSPDTLLPETELLMRDALHGARFAEEVLGAAPARTAWLPDSFGHAGTTPDLLAAMGYEAVAFSRADGEPTIYQWIAALMTGPRPGSTGEALRALGSADFVWRGPAGGEVLAHFMSSPGLYCQGDNIDHDEPIQIAGGHIGPYRGDPGFTDAAIDRYAAELEAMGRTPYRFVPVGCDFQFPKAELLAYLDGYNTRRYPTTGVWAVAASFEEYVALVGAHRAALPEIEADVTPYFMGFYGTRVGLKRRIREATRALVAADLLAVIAGDEPADVRARRTAAWSRLTWTNHHDFITGTANDRVVAEEQEPLVAEVHAEARELVDALAARVSARVAALPGATSRRVLINASGQAQGGVPPFGWRVIDDVEEAPAQVDDAVTLERTDDRITLANARVRVTLTRTVEAGWIMGSLVLDGVEALAAPSFIVRDYDDDGGLWRLGHEMDGCALTPVAAQPGATEVDVLGDARRRIVTLVDAATGVSRQVTLDAGDAGPTVVVDGVVAAGRTRTASFTFVVAVSDLRRTAVAGGVLLRPTARVFTPTWWPAVTWASTGRWAVLLRAATGVRFGADGLVELMVQRDARSEKCDVLGGTGSDPEAQRVAWRLVSLGGQADVAVAARASEAWDRPIMEVRLALPTGPPGPDALPRSGSIVGVEFGPGLIVGVKPGDRGVDVVVRALRLGPAPVLLVVGDALATRPPRRLDAAERDLGPLLPAEGGTIVAVPPGGPAITTIGFQR